MGAMLGTAYGMSVHHLFPGSTAQAGAYGLVGMGAVFAGAARAPITAVLIIFELTGDYQVILPLMFAIALATGVSNLLSADTIYTLKLRRRGINILRGRQVNLMEVITVGEAMQPLPHPLTGAESLEEVIGRMSGERQDALPVVDATGAYRGTVRARDVEEAATDNSLDITAAELAHELPILRTQASLHAALGTLVQHDRTGLPVAADDGRRLAGWLNQRDVLRAYSERLGASIQRERPTPSRTLTTGQAEAAHPAGGKLAGMRLVDLEISAGPAIGRRITDLDLPRAVIVMALRRDGKTVEPDPGTKLGRGDRLTLLAPAEQADGLAERLHLDNNVEARPDAG